MHDLLIVLKTFNIPDPFQCRVEVRPGTRVSLPANIADGLIAKGYLQRITPKRKPEELELDSAPAPPLATAPAAETKAPEKPMKPRRGK